MTVEKKFACDDCGEEICLPPGVDDLDKCPKCEKHNLTLEEDVLDTWFSSGLWPFSTLKWPDTKHPDYTRFYPTNTRETGYDILFFWVAREMMLGVELTGKSPYSTVYLHGLIRDEKGRKISKSMGDVDRFDPLNIIDKYGADSLRFLLISNSIPGTDTNLDPRHLEAAHRFHNKIWQSTRFVLNNIQENDKLLEFSEIKKNEFIYADRWILSRLNKLVKEATECFTNFNYLKAARDIKTFYWNEFCDWYIEISKIRLYGNDINKRIVPKVILLKILDITLRLLHPIIPFMTEQLWQHLPESIKESPALIIAHWPKVEEDFINDELETEFQFTINLVHELRRIRTEFNIGLAAKIPLLINLGEKDKIFELTKNEIVTLAKIDVDKLVVSSELTPPRRAAKIILPGITAYIPLEEIVDLEKEKKKIENKLNKVIRDIKQTSIRLDGPFVQKAPLEIVEREKVKLIDLKHKKTQLEEQLRILS
jgi:valyl-tRNA synthetase